MYVFVSSVPQYVLAMAFVFSGSHNDELLLLSVEILTLNERINWLSPD